MSIHASPRWIDYDIVETYPFSSNIFTQGLHLDDTILYSSSGLYEHSYISAVTFPEMTPVASRKLDKQYFAEGLTIIENELYLCTWKSKRCFVYDKESLKQKQSFTIKSEGWGLTHIGDSLILSDGTDKLYFINRFNFELEKTLSVTIANKPTRYLNELEHHSGYIYANVWGSPYIVLIHSKTGVVDYVIDGTRLIQDQKPNLAKGHVLNGIAFDPQHNRLLLTGKRWTTLYALLLEKTPKIALDTSN